MIDNDFKKVLNYHMYLRYFIITTDKGDITIENGSMEGTHWTCFYKKDNKAMYFGSFGGLADKFNSTNYQNRSLFMILNFETSIVEYAVYIVSNFLIY